MIAGIVLERVPYANSSRGVSAGEADTGGIRIRASEAYVVSTMDGCEEAMVSKERDLRVRDSQRRPKNTGEHHGQANREREK